MEGNFPICTMSVMSENKTKVRQSLKPILITALLRGGKKTQQTKLFSTSERLAAWKTLLENSFPGQFCIKLHVLSSFDNLGVNKLSFYVFLN